jgi:hypothetical protein
VSVPGSRGDQPSDEALQELLAWVVRAHSARIQEQRAVGESAPAPFGAASGVSETDVLLVARSLLDAFELAPFELAMLPR